jgi:hypothetical protein
LTTARYTEWVHFDAHQAGQPHQPKWYKLRGAELYHYPQDALASAALDSGPDCLWDCEYDNVIDEPEYADVKARMAKALHFGWRTMLPTRGSATLGPKDNDAELVHGGFGSRVHEE